MNKLLKNLSAKTETIDLGHGNEIEIRSLKVPDIAEFIDLAQKNKVDKAFDLVLYRTLRSAIPTKEESEDGLDDAGLKDFMENKMDGFIALKIVRKVQELSGLIDEDDTKKSLEKTPKEEE